MCTFPPFTPAFNIVWKVAFFVSCLLACLALPHAHTTITDERMCMSLNIESGGVRGEGRWGTMLSVNRWRKRRFDYNCLAFCIAFLNRGGICMHTIVCPMAGRRPQLVNFKRQSNFSVGGNLCHNVHVL